MKKRIPAATLALALICTAPAWATELTASVDAPSDLAGADYLANQLFDADAGAYSLRFDGPAEGLAPSISVSALALREDGGFLFSCDVPCDAGGTTYEPGDVIAWDGAAYSLHLSRADLSLPPDAQIDALALLAGGDLALSFAEPVTVAGTTYLPADVAREQGGALSLLFEATASGLAASSDVVGYDRTESGVEYFAFSEPTDASGLTVLPGQVARRDAGGWSIHYDDPAWPAAASLSALSLPGSPGRVTDLRLAKGVGGIDLDWQPSCSGEADDYAVLAGQAGNWDSHQPLDCSTSGATAASVTPAGGQRYYLVVPLNGAFEGSYGLHSDGSERAPAAAPCRAEQRLRPCP